MRSSTTAGGGQGSSNLIRWVAALLKPHVPALLIAALLAAVVSACRAALVFVTRDLLDDLLATGGNLALWLLPLAVVLLFAVQGLARIGRTWITRRAALRSEQVLRARLFRAFLAYQPARLQEEGLGDALARLTHDAGKVRTAVGAAVTVFQRPLTALALAIAALLMAPQLALWAALGLPFVAGAIALSGRLTRKASREQHRSLGQLVGAARDGLEGVRTLQAYGAEDASAGRFDRLNEREISAGLRTSLYRMSGPPAVELAAALGIALVIGVGATQVQAGELSTGSLVAFLVALGLLSEPLKGISVAVGLWEEARGGLERVLAALEGATLSREELEGGRSVLAPGPVELELDGLGVDRSGRAVLEDLSLRAHPGQILVIQGESGAGKSTLLDAIVGFVPSAAGTIRWSGQESNQLTLSSRRQQLALVDQEPWLGSGTVAEAIRIGREDASAQDITAAALAAGLSLDLDRPVGDGAAGVSGGERQRIALARALVREAPLLLLDEPTSSLDLEAERAFLETLEGLSEGRTILLVTHRPGPLEIATRVFDLADGALVERSPGLAEVG